MEFHNLCGATGCPQAGFDSETQEVHLRLSEKPEDRLVMTSQAFVDMVEGIKRGEADSILAEIAQKR